MEKSKVYWTKEITPQSLVKIYECLNQKLIGNVAVKISTGELGGHNFLDPNLIKDLVFKLNGTIVECCTAYRGKRFDVKDHLETIEKHGFDKMALFDIMDSSGDMELHFEGGKHLKGINYVGANLKNYNSMLVLSHFKGHAMAGFGGALKNLSIGVASKNGKAWIHSAGYTTDPDEMWNHIDDQNGFLESMAEADKAVIQYFKPNNMVYINVANKISIDCDCDANPKDSEMADLGIYASLDPVALDKCCYDAVMNSNDPGAKSLIDRINEKHGIRVIEYANELGLGNKNYEIINIDN